MIILRSEFGRDDPASLMRHGVGAALAAIAEAGTDDAWMDDVLIVVSELVQNVLQHTPAGGELTLYTTASGVLIEVADTVATEPRLQHPDARRAGGRGLLLIDAMSLAWGTRCRDTGKTVWALMPAPATADSIRPSSDGRVAAS
ncbi:ATP-binding protein [Actinoplanes xinjiangensis]|uniref:ATP-binding protein n=1 Tax=Actinoplanes xinjiangensis TaxID=512350 RepID=UPI00341F1F28